MKRLLLYLALFLSIAGCDWIEKVYTWHQDVNPVGTFRVRVKVTHDKNLLMLEDFEQVGQKKSTIVRDYFDKCQYFDEDNWTCNGAPGHERVVMSHGDLTHFYWSTVREYKRTYRLPFVD